MKIEIDIDEGNFEEDCAAYDSYAVFNTETNRGSVYWLANGAESPSGRFDDEIVRAFETKRVPAGSAVDVYFGAQRENARYSEQYSIRL